MKHRLDRYGQTELMQAAKHGRLDDVVRCIAEGVPLDVHAKYGLTALMLAVVNGRLEIAALLDGAGADRNHRGTGAPGFAGKTALDLARDRGDPALVALLEAPPRIWAHPADWAEAARWIPFPLSAPSDAGGARPESLAVHLRDHRGRAHPVGRRSIEAHYPTFVWSQSRPGADEARRLALDVSYGATPIETTVGAHAARGYHAEPPPAADDPDPPLPAVLTWSVDEFHYLLASAERSLTDLAKIAASVRPVPLGGG